MSRAPMRITPPSRAVNHAILAAAGLWRRNNWLGLNLTRLPGAACARREIAGAQETIGELTGSRPRFSRAPVTLRRVVDC